MKQLRRTLEDAGKLIQKFREGHGHPRSEVGVRQGAPVPEVVHDGGERIDGASDGLPDGRAVGNAVLPVSVHIQIPHEKHTRRGHKVSDAVVQMTEEVVLCDGAGLIQWKAQRGGNADAQGGTCLECRADREWVVAHPHTRRWCAPSSSFPPLLP